MRLSAPEEYGFRCLLQIAREGEDASLTLPEIARREAITIANTGKILGILKRAKLVESVRGRQGGYRLARSPEHISVADILVAMSGDVYEGGFCSRVRSRRKKCVHAGDCSIRPLWSIVERLIRGVLERTTVRDLMRSEPTMTTWLGKRFAEAVRAVPPGKEEV
jgi:Rrf2 family iron-sulfur cluster assembly transcriptional regulator